METTQSAKVANWGSVCKRAQMQTVTSDFARIKTSAACRTFMSAKKCRLSTARSKISISQQKTWRYFKRCPRQKQLIGGEAVTKTSTTAHLRVWALAVSRELLRVCFHSLCFLCVRVSAKQLEGGEASTRAAIVQPFLVAEEEEVTPSLSASLSLSRTRPACGWTGQRFNCDGI